MQAITVRDREAGVAGLSLTDLAHPEAASNDVVVRVHAAGFIPTELDWPDTWTDRAGTGGLFSSLSNPIAPGSPTSPRGYGMDASSRWWAPCCHWLTLPPHSRPTSASLARRSCA